MSLSHAVDRAAKRWQALFSPSVKTSSSESKGRLIFCVLIHCQFPADWLTATLPCVPDGPYLRSWILPSDLREWMIGKKIKHQALETKNREKSHKGMWTRKMSCVPIIYFRLDYFTAVLSLRGALIPTWVVLSQIALPICMFFNATSSSTATFLTVNCKQTERQKECLSYVNQTHITSLIVWLECAAVAGTTLAN